MAEAVFKGRLSGSDSPAQERLRKAAQADSYEFARRLDRKQDVPAVIAEFTAFKGRRSSVIIDPPAYTRWSARGSARRDDHRRYIASREKTEVQGVDPSSMF
jgi:acetolactate synthase-1/2/3 large subunit